MPILPIIPEQQQPDDPLIKEIMGLRQRLDNMTLPAPPAPRRFNFVRDALAPSLGDLSDSLTGVDTRVSRARLREIDRENYEEMLRFSQARREELEQQLSRAIGFDKFIRDRKFEKTERKQKIKSGETKQKREEFALQRDKLESQYAPESFNLNKRLQEEQLSRAEYENSPEYRKLREDRVRAEIASKEARGSGKDLTPQQRMAMLLHYDPDLRREAGGATTIAGVPEENKPKVMAFIEILLDENIGPLTQKAQKSILRKYFELKDKGLVNEVQGNVLEWKKGPEGEQAEKDLLLTALTFYGKPDVFEELQNTDMLDTVVEELEQYSNIPSKDIIVKILEMQTGIGDPNPQVKVRELFSPEPELKIVPKMFPRQAKGFQALGSLLVDYKGMGYTIKGAGSQVYKTYKEAAAALKKIKEKRLHPIKRKAIREAHKGFQE